MKTNNNYKKNYSYHEDEIRAELSFEEVVYRIKNIYEANYNPNTPNFDAWDQLLACESLEEATPIKQIYFETYKNTNGSSNVNDTYKHNVNFELTQSKQQVIAKLSKCNYRTSRIIIARLLEEFFKEWPSKEGHWLYISQHYSPRAINRTINQLIKLQMTGQKTIDIPPRYFTALIKFRKKRKS